jgi:NhaA family Na+:H+ antiporter
MSIFVDTLSFQDASAVEEMRNAGKIAILVGSLAAGILGSALITLVSKLHDSK